MQSDPNIRLKHIYTPFATFQKAGEYDPVEPFTYDSSLAKQNNIPDHLNQHIKRFWSDSLDSQASGLDQRF